MENHCFWLNLFFHDKCFLSLEYVSFLRKPFTWRQTNFLARSTSFLKGKEIGIISMRFTEQIIYSKLFYYHWSFLLLHYRNYTESIWKQNSSVILLTSQCLCHYPATAFGHFFVEQERQKIQCHIPLSLLSGIPAPVFAGDCSSILVLF